MSFLAESSWLNPQIDFLLWVQNIRLSLGSGLDLLFLKATMFGEFFISTLLMAIIYWCIDSYVGVYLFTLNSISLMLSQLSKMIACVYRPWVLSDKIKPVESAIKMASGYSFPSGHSSIVTSSFGGTAYVYRKKLWLSIPFIIIILFVGFSRLYLGVHTPQDVIGGILIGGVSIFVIDKIIKWCEINKNRYLYFLVVINIFVIASMVYMLTKIYPVDYVDGKILVDPNEIIYKTVIPYGWATGLFNGVILLKRFFDFDAKKGSILAKFIRGFVGIVCLGIFLYFLNDYLWVKEQNIYFAFIISMLGGLFVTLIYPYFITKVERKFNLDCK